MLLYIVSTICIILALLMFRVNLSKKIGILFLLYILFSCVNIPFFGRANFIIPIFFVLSEISNFNKIWAILKNTLVWKVILIFLVSMVFLIFGSPHLHDLGMIRYVIQEEVLFKYFLLLYAFYCCRNYKDLRTIVNFTLVGFFIMSFLGIINYLTKESTYIGELMTSYKNSAMFQDINLSAMFANSYRFRVNASFLNPFDYGYMCIALFLLYTFSYQKDIITKRLYSIIVLLCLFGIFVCGSRTVILTFVISAAFYVFFAFNAGKTIKVAFISLIMLFVAYQTVPYVNEKVNFALSAVDKNYDEDGSTLEGRSLQYATVFYHIKDNLLLGKGYSYFTIDLGWAQGKQGLVDKELYGLEGVAMNYLLERGIVGYALYLAFYTILLFYLYRHRSRDRQLSSLGMSIIVAYTIFSNMTGELLSVQISLLILGCVFGLYKMNEEYEESVNFNFNPSI